MQAKFRGGCILAIIGVSGREAVFINLSKLRFDLCRGCCNLCATTNMCAIKDELHPYLKLVLKSEALVLGTPTNSVWQQDLCIIS